MPRKHRPKGMTDKMYHKLTAQKRRKDHTLGRISRMYLEKTQGERKFPDVMIAEMVLGGFGPRFKMMVIYDE